MERLRFPQPLIHLEIVSLSRARTLRKGKLTRLLVTYYITALDEYSALAPCAQSAVSYDVFSVCVISFNPQFGTMSNESTSKRTTIVLEVLRPWHPASV